MMDETKLLDRLQQAVKAAYVNAESPSYEFVARALKRPFPYAALVQALTYAGFVVVDTTDGNEDVAWHLGVRRGIDETDVAVSMTGPFARVGMPVSASDADLLRDELERILRSHCLLVIPLHMLSASTALVLQGAQADLGQALFANDDR